MIERGTMWIDEELGEVCIVYQYNQFHIFR